MSISPCFSNAELCLWGGVRPCLGAKKGRPPTPLTQHLISGVSAKRENAAGSGVVVHLGGLPSPAERPPPRPLLPPCPHPPCPPSFRGEPSPPCRPERPPSCLLPCRRSLRYSTQSFNAWMGLPRLSRYHQPATTAATHHHHHAGRLSRVTPLTRPCRLLARRRHGFGKSVVSH